VAPYRGALRRAIVAYKLERDLRWAKPFALLLQGFLRSHENWFDEFGVLCPVPAYDGPGTPGPCGPVELLCRELAALTGAWWPVEPLLAKAVATGEMRPRRRPERRGPGARELARSFYVPSPGQAQGRRVVLVDDVCASGTTLLSAAACLRRAGAEEVVGLVVARASWRGPGQVSLGEAASHRV
jgi:predicted amidophosphoribosyltransferase